MELVFFQDIRKILNRKYILVVLATISIIFILAVAIIFLDVDIYRITKGRKKIVIGRKLAQKINGLYL